MSRAEDAREDIAFRMGYLATPPVAAGPAITSPYPQQPAIMGSPLGAGSTPSYQTPPPSAGPAPGGVLGTGMTGGQMGLALMGGALSFLGGYQRNPGLLQLSRQTNYALGQSFAAQAAQKRQDQYSSIVQGMDVMDQKSVAGRAEELYKAGFTQEADKLMSRAETLWARDNLTFKQKADMMRPFRDRAIDQKQILHNFQQTIEDRRGFENLTEADAIGLAMQFQRGEIPGVLSDREYARIAGMETGTQVINVLRQSLGLNPSAPPTSVIKALYQRVYSNARNAEATLQSQAAFLGADSKEIWGGRELPPNLLPGLYKLPQAGPTQIPEQQQRFSEWFNQTPPGRAADEMLNFFGWTR